ncbi:MAG TPA: nitroreductase family protein [Desulfatiglandales bacterium]|nr:nitroreductase family protein [Desulfatiglandales bacterium]
MELIEAIKGRRSIRRYRDRKVQDSVVKELLDLALHAPSSMNGQPWHFIVIRDDKTKKRLAKIKNRYCPAEKKMYQADFLRNAPVIIVICVDRQGSYDRGVENAVLAAANIMLGAYSMGLGSVYMSAYRANDTKMSEEIREILKIPPDMDPITIIPLGYPDELPEPKTITILKEVVSNELFKRR